MQRFVDRVIKSRVRRELNHQRNMMLRHPPEACVITYEPLMVPETIEQCLTEYPYILRQKDNKPGAAPVYYSAASLQRYWKTTKAFRDPITSNNVSCVDVWCVSWLQSDPVLIDLYRGLAHKQDLYSGVMTEWNQQVLFIVTLVCIKLGRILMTSGFPAPSVSCSLRDFEIGLHNLSVSVSSQSLHGDMMSVLTNLDKMRVFMDPHELYGPQTETLLNRIANIITDVIVTYSAQQSL